MQLPISQSQLRVQEEFGGPRGAATLMSSSKLPAKLTAAAAAADCCRHQRALPMPGLSWRLGSNQHILDRSVPRGAKSF